MGDLDRISVRSRREVQALKAEFLGHAQTMAAQGADKSLPFGHRYEANVMQDECLEVVEDCDRFLGGG